MKVRNTSDVRQAVHTTTGVVFIHPGKTWDVDLTEEGLKLVQASTDLRAYGEHGEKRTKKPKDAEVASESADVHGDSETQPAGQSEGDRGED